MTFLILAALGVVFTIGGALLMKRSQRVLRERGAGIVAFELSGTTECSRRVLAAWGVDGRAAARENLLADIPFILGYATFLAVAAWAPAHELARDTWGWTGAVSVALAIAAVVAGTADVIEDICLFRVLAKSNPPQAVQPWARIARTAATVKFALVGTVMLWLLLVAWPVVLTPGRAG